MKLIVLAAIVSVLAFATPAYAKPNCHASKTCSSSPAPDVCDTGGVAGATVADQVADDFGRGGSVDPVLTGMIEDPSGNWGLVSGLVYTTGNGSQAATEAACALNSVPPIVF